MTREGTSWSNPPQPWAWLVEPDGQARALVGDALTCGRARQNELVLEDPSVSRRHVRFERLPEGCVLTDLGSSNGTFVNEERLSPASPRALRDGDRLTIGDYACTLRLLPRPMAAAPVASQWGTRDTREHNTAQLLVVLPEIVRVDKLVYAKIRAQGVLNSETIQPLLEVCHWAVEQNVFRILLDFSNVDYIDSAGVGFLVRLQRQFGELGGGVAIAAPSPGVRQILEMMNLSSFLPMYPDERHAMAAADSTVP